MNVPPISERREITVRGWTVHDFRAYVEYESQFVGAMERNGDGLAHGEIERWIGRREHTGYNGHPCVTHTAIVLAS